MSPTAPTPHARLLAAGLDELGLRADAAQLDALLVLTEMLETWAARINLTGHRDPEAIVRHLHLGAAALAAQVPEISSLADLGSGAGFPGLPWAILRPDCRFTLVESRERRHHFQRAVIRTLGLANVRAVRGRAEELDPTPHAAVVAQAMARPGRALRWMLPWAQEGGLLLLPGSETPPQVPEIEEISDSELRRYRVPCGGPERTLWIGRVRCGTKQESP